MSGKGLPPDHRHRHTESPYLGTKRTKSGRKRTSALECRLLGEERTSIRTSGTSLVSHKQTLSIPQQKPDLGHIPMPVEEDEPWKDQEDQVKYVPLQAKNGDLAIFLQKGAFEIMYEKEKYFIVPQSSILMLEREEDLN